MAYRIINTSKLIKILWADFFLGAITGLLGLSCFQLFIPIFGLTAQVLIWISAITFLYSLFALRLAVMKPPSIPLLRILIIANWAWTLISLGIIAFHFSDATPLGQAWLVLQIIVVGGLAWLEGNQLEKK